MRPVASTQVVAASGKERAKLGQLQEFEGIEYYARFSTGNKFDVLVINKVCAGTTNISFSTTTSNKLSMYWQYYNY